MGPASTKSQVQKRRKEERILTLSGIDETSRGNKGQKEDVHKDENGSLLVTGRSIVRKKGKAGADLLVSKVRRGGVVPNHYEHFKCTMF